MKEIIITSDNSIPCNMKDGRMEWSGSGFETELTVNGGCDCALLCDLTGLPQKRCPEEDFSPCAAIFESDVTLTAAALHEGTDVSSEFRLSFLGKKHPIKIVKTGEYGVISNIRLLLPDDAEISRPLRKEKTRLFFIGDSMTAGLYNMRTESEDPPYYSPEIQNSERSFASICAKNLGADFNIYAISGAPLNFMADVFFSRVGDEKPDIITVLLGTNDVRGSEGDWQERKLCFTDDYKKFIGKLLEKYPDAKIVCMAGMMFCDYCSYVERAVTELSDGRVYYLGLPPLLSNGHPRASEQEKTAKSLMSFIFKNNLL